MIVPRPPVIEAAPAGAAASVLWAPRIAIVWPNNANGNQTSVALSQFVNISVWPANQVSCSSDPQAGPGGVHQFYLWVAKNNEPAQQVLINPVFIQRTVHGVTFPSDEYNNVPVDLVTSPADQYRFSVGLVPGESNIWVHAADARTYAPNPVIPTGYGTPGQLDSRLQIVWPHDGQGRYCPRRPSGLRQHCGRSLHPRHSAVGAPGLPAGRPEPSGRRRQQSTDPGRCPGAEEYLYGERHALSSLGLQQHPGSAGPAVPVPGSGLLREDLVALYKHLDARRRCPDAPAESDRSVGLYALT